MTGARDLAVIGAASCLATACAVGPNFQRPPPPTIDRYTVQPLPAQTAGADGQRFVWGGAVAARWWTFFGSPALDALEDEALKANPDMRSAQAALRQSHELYLAQRTTLWPTVALAVNGTRARNSGTIAPLLSNNSNEYTLYQGQLNLSYDPDVFGGLHRQVESAAASEEAQRYQTEAVYLTLTTNLADAAIQLAGLQEQLDATKRLIDADQRTLDLTRQQQTTGEAATTDVGAALNALEQAEQLAPPLRKQIDQQHDLISMLTGRAASDAATDSIALADLTLPRSLPVSLPADLVRQRPDVLAAEANLHVASAQVGVAIAARLPDFTLTGSAGGASTVLMTLLKPDNTLWFVSGAVAQSVFDAGALRHKQKAAQAALDQAKAQYRSAVLVALQNTADTLQAIVEDADADRHAEAAEAAADRSLRLAEQQQQHGESGVLPVLTAQTVYEQAAVVSAQSQAARYADTVALFQALGGGWWNDPQREANAAR